MLAGSHLRLQGRNDPLLRLKSGQNTGQNAPWRFSDRQHSRNTATKHFSETPLREEWMASETSRKCQHSFVLVPGQKAPQIPKELQG